MQVDPIKPTLKPPGTKRLKLEYDELLSNFAFKFNLRRYGLVLASAALLKYDSTSVGRRRLTHQTHDETA